MKILMFGRGVIATMYGWALERAGHTVEFYVRPGRAAQYGPAVALDFLDAREKLRGVEVRGSWPVVLREELPFEHDYELIVISVVHDAFPQAAAFVGPRVGGATVLVFNNLWTDARAAASAIPTDRLAWGFPAAGGGFDAAGVLRGALLGRVDFGTFGTEPGPRDLAVREAFKAAGLKIREHRDFQGWLWVHFVSNAGMLSQALAVGSMAEVMHSHAQLMEVVRNVRELLGLVAARGIDLKEHRADAGLFMLPAWLGAAALRLAVLALRPVQVVLASHSNPAELRLYGVDALAEARRIGFPVPRLAALVERYAGRSMGQ